MSEQHDVDIEEVEYLRHGTTPLMARMFRPRGKGPFPAVVEAHGGAWVGGNRANNDAINRAVAKGGVVVAALEFRNPPEATYPGSVQDVNYGVRWLKAEAQRFNSKPEWVGSIGTSSGGHLVVLNALKPNDPRYSARPVPGGRFDARVPYCVSLWPVICPLGRYRAHKANPPAGSTAAQTQVQYWLTEDAMAEGSPMLALERGDAVEMPPILYLQNPLDVMHPRANVEQFVANYKKRGGNVRLEWFEGKNYDLVRSDPDSASARRAIGQIVDFIHQHAK